MFKAKVALAAMAGDKTLSKLAQRFKVHPNQITEWKRQLSERAVDVFGGTTVADPPVDLKVLHPKIGQVTLKNDFSESALSQVGLLSESDELTATTHFRSAVRSSRRVLAGTTYSICPNRPVAPIRRFSPSNIKMRLDTGNSTGNESPERKKELRQLT